MLEFGKGVRRNSSYRHRRSSSDRSASSVTASSRGANPTTSSTGSVLREAWNGRMLLNAKGGKAMPRIKHIALTTKEPAKVADFYKNAFGMQEIRRAPNGAVFLTDGYI